MFPWQSISQLTSTVCRSAARNTFYLKKVGVTHVLNTAEGQTSGTVDTNQVSLRQTGSWNWIILTSSLSPIEVLQTFQYQVQRTEVTGCFPGQHLHTFQWDLGFYWGGTGGRRSDGGQLTRILTMIIWLFRKSLGKLPERSFEEFCSSSGLSDVETPDDRSPGSRWGEKRKEEILFVVT